jgi:lipoprotein-anchoring transpeptidase ErfK/SrfK
MKLMTLTGALPPPSPEPPPPRSTAGRMARALILLLSTAALVITGLLALQWSRGGPSSMAPADRFEVPGDPERLASMAAALEKEVSKLEAANKKQRQRITTLIPRGTYLVIDTGANKLFLMQDDQVVREAVVSTGSGVRLQDPDKPRSWIFDTPRGEFQVIRKVNEPVWTKPDWAFVETGEDMPRSFNDRVEEGVLGDYALDLGDGYLIHGTLFERALGLHVTHGCVRMGAKDLEEVFKRVKIGTKVFIV